MDIQVNPPQRRELVLRVAVSTDVHKLAHSIQKNIEEEVRVIVSCIGTTTINIAVKAVTVANGKTAQNGYVLLLLPVFFSERGVEEDVEHTVIRFHIMKYVIGG